MSVWVTAGIGCVMYLDAVLFYRRAPDLFKRIFKVSGRVTAVFTVIAGLIIIFSEDRWEVLSVYVAIFLLPVYILRRMAFIREESRLALSPAPADDRYQQLSNAYGIFIQWFFYLVCISLILEGLGKVVPSLATEFAQLVVASMVSSAILLFLICREAGTFSGQGFWASVGMTTKTRSHLRFAFIPTVSGLVFAFISSSIILNRKIQPVTPMSEVLEAAQSSAAILGFIVLAVLIAPLFEEIVFRGYLYRVLRRVKGEAFTIVFVSLLFAFLHVGQYWGDWAAIAMVAVLGFVLTYLRFWAGTAVASTVMHYVYNTGVTVIPILIMLQTNPAYVKYQLYFHEYTSQQKIELLEESLRADPDLAPAYNDLAWIYAGENTNLLQALSLVEKALVIDGNNRAYLDTKAVVLEKLGRDEEARQIRERIKGLNRS